MLTQDQLRSIMPGLPAAKSGTLFPFLVSAMTERAIEAPARIAAFLAQLAHESAQFRFMEEIWGPTAAQRRYEPPSTLATTLGNTTAGDGLRFKGRGPIQITGRANYQRFGSLLGVDLVADPARAAQPDVAFRIASLFWMKKGLNELADLATPDAFREITRRINGGFNGLEERQKFYATARKVLGVPDAPIPRGIEPPRPLPPEPDSDFTRGLEAIQADAAGRRRRRKKAPAKRKTATVRRKKAPVKRTKAAAKRKTAPVARKRKVRKSR